jgi:pilus assembly protein FimV
MIVVITGLLWFVRRGGDSEIEDIDRPWETLDADEIEVEGTFPTATIDAPTPEEAILVVEEDSAATQAYDETFQIPVPDFSSDNEVASDSVESDSVAAESFGSFEDTFSSETAINLDDSDPIAEADFHMAYGLYDQAAELINKELESNSTDTVLLSKLCEIYFVWGNRDQFVDAAERLKNVIGDTDGADWPKIVIMGQQIAADHPLFSEAQSGGAAQAIDVSFDEDDDNAGALDMDFGDETGDASGFIDLEPTAEMPIASTTAPTSEESSTVLDVPGSELPSIDFDEKEAAIFDDPDATVQSEVLSEAVVQEALSDLDATGFMDSFDENADSDPTVITKGVDIDRIDDTVMDLAPDETGQVPVLSAEAEQEPVDFEVDDGLLEASGLTEVLGDDGGVESAAGIELQLSDDDATMLAPVGALAPMDDDGVDFDFAKTENLPAELFAEDGDLDATVETPAIAGTDVDLDLDDLTAALAVSEIGDTMARPIDDATLEQPLPDFVDNFTNMDDESPTMELVLDDVVGDLGDARTMTEVGTKLDLARAYVDMGDPAGARGILEEVLDEGDGGQKEQAQALLDTLAS